ncbi:MAG: AAA family ATPase [Candidatus Nealsonbacteria bacterium]
MFNFNLRKTNIYQAVLRDRNIFFRFAKTEKKLFLTFSIIILLFFLYGFVPENFSLSFNRKLLGLSIILLVFSIVSWIKECFLSSRMRSKVKTPLKEIILEPEEHNLAEFLSFKVAKAVFKSIRFAKSKKISQIDSSLLFYFVLKDNPNINFIFIRALLNPNKIEEILNENLKILKRTAISTKGIKEGFKEVFADSFKQVILESFNIAEKRGHPKIELLDIVSALAEHDSIFKKLLIKYNLKAEDIENLSLWLENLEKQEYERKKFWEWQNLLKKGSLAKEWTAGYTITLDKFSFDLSETLKRQGFPETVGHQEEIEEIERILSKTEDNNALIVGEPGSGRKSIVQALAKRSILGESLPDINYKKVVYLDLPLLLSQTESIKATESTLETILNEVVTAGNIILVIDEFHNYITGVARLGAIDISGILSSYLNLPQFQFIGITSYKGLHQYIERHPSILNFFEKVEVSEISQQDVLVLLEDLALRLEAKYKKFISYQALRDTIFYCDRYLHDTPFPEKATELLDEAMIYVVQKKEEFLSSKHVAKIISDKTDIPVGKIEIKEKEILLDLENLIHKRIINQEEAVKEVSDALRRARAGISIRKGPMGSFLFLGPTGVGKTETSKSLVEIYFNSEDKMIRLDMSEFQNITDISRLIGSSSQEGLLITRVREEPFSLILLDEIEKAHPNILNLFLQVLDEGHITDGLGRKVDFRNTIIIATSNAGYLIILEALKMQKKMSEIKEELLDYLFKERIFRPEFINRFDAVVVFKSLTKENLFDISELLLKKVKKNLAQKSIEFVITPELKEKIVELGYEPKFGAREMQRVIQDKVGNVLAKALLSNQIKGGDSIEINPEDFTLRINP